MKSFRYILLATLLSVLVWAIACSDDENTVLTPKPLGTVTFHLDNVVDLDPVVLDETNLQYQNPSGRSYSISDLHYVISDVMLHTTSSETFGMDGIHYRNQDKPETRSFSIANVPAGTYDRMSFTFGLDETKNLRDKYVDHPHDFHLDMAWPTGLGAALGYHYMEFEGKFRDSQGGLADFTTHTGARQCAQACGPDQGIDETPHHHHFRVVLPLDSATRIDGNAWEVTVEVNVNGWFTDPIDFDWNDLANQMIMPNLDAQAKLMANGPSCFSASIAAKQ